MSTFPNVYEPYGKTLFEQDDPIRGKWNERFFEKPQPIILELGCGKGEYTIGLAERFKEQNFIGVDIKGNRMWKGARRALRDNLNNVAFLRTRIEFVKRIFAPGEVDEIWITFPDPQPKKALKRLTSSWFLNEYRKILKPGGIIHLKTDSLLLFEYTSALLETNLIQPLIKTNDLYASTSLEEVMTIKTFYESGFLTEGKKITYLRFVIPASIDLKEPYRQFR